MNDVAHVEATRDSQIGVSRFLTRFLALVSNRWFTRFEWALAAAGLSFVTYLALTSQPMFEPVITCVREHAWAEQGTLLMRYKHAHLGIFIAYVLIPFTAVLFLVLRRDIPLISAPVLLVGAFVLACGIGHWLERYAAAHPIYWFIAWWHALTAYISLLTWWHLLFHIMPKLLALPSPKQYRDALMRAGQNERNAMEALARVAQNNKDLETKEQDLREALVAADTEREEAHKIVNKLELALDTVKRQQEAIRALSTPVLPIWESTIVVPIIGVFDSSRSEQLMEVVLEKIGSSSASLMILDVTGVPIVDTAVAQQLTRIAEAAGLMGCGCIMTGIKGAVARTIVQLGITFGPSVRTCATLQHGMARAVAELKQKQARPV